MELERAELEEIPKMTVIMMNFSLLPAAMHILFIYIGLKRQF
jgi:hypothetical protein